MYGVFSATGSERQQTPVRKCPARRLEWTNGHRLFSASQNAASNTRPTRVPVIQPPRTSEAKWT